jgi:hypothetical protein
MRFTTPFLAALSIGVPVMLLAHAWPDWRTAYRSKPASLCFTTGLLVLLVLLKSVALIVFFRVAVSPLELTEPFDASMCSRYASDRVAVVIPFGVLAHWLVYPRVEAGARAPRWLRPVERLLRLIWLAMLFLPHIDY